MKLAGKVALVTGSGRGIGAAIAKALAKEGAQVVINYRKTEERALQVKREIESFGGRAIAVQGDVSKEEDINRMTAQATKALGPIDILVNNAVLPPKTAPFLKTSWDELLAEIEVAVKGTYHCCFAVLPAMMEKRWGRIINVGASGQAHPAFQIYGYWVGKAGMLALARTLALEFGPYGITVNSVLPGRIATEIHREERYRPKAKLSIEEQEKLVREKQAIKRTGQPEDIAAAVMYFASEEASFITGCALHVSGGMVVTPV